MSEIFASAERQEEFRAALRAIVTSSADSTGTASTPSQMFNMLLDLLPDAQLERNILRSAIENGVAGQLANLAAARIPADTAIRLAAESLAGRTGLTAESCAWACREIAIALGLAAATAGVSPAPAPAAFLSEAPQTVPPQAVPPQAVPPQAVPPQAVPPQAVPPQAEAPIPATPAAATPPAMPAWDQAPAGMPPPPAEIAADPTIINPAFDASPSLPPSVIASPARRSRKPLAIIAAVVVVAAAAGAGAAVLLSSHSSPKPVAKPSVHVYRLGSEPVGVAVAGPVAWVAQRDRVQALNASNGRPGAVIDDANGPTSIAAGDGYVWVANDESPPGSVTQISARTGQVIRTFGSSSHIANPEAIAVVGDTVWVANLGASTSTGFSGFGSVTELSAVTGNVIRTIIGKAGGITYPCSIAVSGRYLWVIDSGYQGGLGGVTRIDSSTGATLTQSGGTATTSLFARPSSVAVAGPHVWVLNTPYRGPFSLTELNASDGSYVGRWLGLRYDFGPFVGSFAYRPEGVAAAGDRVWVVNPHGGSNGLGSVTEINARTGAVIRVLSGSIYQFNNPSAVAVAGSAVWIANSGSGGAPGSITVLRSFR